MVREEQIVYDGIVVGYRRYEVGTGVFGSDRFLGYRWLEQNGG